MATQICNLTRVLRQLGCYVPWARIPATVILAFPPQMILVVSSSSKCVGRSSHWIVLNFLWSLHQNPCIQHLTSCTETRHVRLRDCCCRYPRVQCEKTARTLECNCGNCPGQIGSIPWKLETWELMQARPIECLRSFQFKRALAQIEKIWKAMALPGLPGVKSNGNGSQHQARTNTPVHQLNSWVQWYTGKRSAKNCAAFSQQQIGSGEDARIVGEVHVHMLRSPQRRELGLPTRIVADVQGSPKATPKEARHSAAKCFLQRCLEMGLPIPSGKSSSVS